MRFAGAVAMITGTALGIGAATARAFAREGARVAMLDIDEPRNAAVGDEVKTLGGDPLVLRADVTASADVRRAVEAITARWGRVDILVNNAGGFATMRLTEDIPDDEWETIFRFNVTSAFLCTKAVLPIMKRQRSGRIVNFSSVVARAGAIPVTSHYASAKAAIVGFTRHLALEVGPHGITVNAVAPGTTLTERVRAVRSPEESRKIAERVPLRRLGEPDDIADVVLFLASDSARYMTGAVLDVNGGLVMA
jgi:NAD(P)-dependent dehydrogenase (short-subunit alcohol dehydrogenase family)